MLLGLVMVKGLLVVVEMELLVVEMEFFVVVMELLVVVMEVRLGFGFPPQDWAHHQQLGFLPPEEMHYQTSCRHRSKQQVD